MSAPPKREINKIAAPPPARPASRGPAPTAQAPATPAAKPGERTVPVRPGAPVAPKPAGRVGHPSIVEMQKAIIELSQNVIGQMNVGGLNSPDQAEQVAAGGRMSFNDFMVKNYLRNSEVQGVEFDPQTQVNQMKDKTPSGLKSMHVVMNTLSRIGNSKKEFSADGIWGPRTNNALKNVYAFATSLITLSKDFALPSKSFTEKDLATFQSLVPTMEQTEKDIPILDKIKRAPELTKLIKGIGKLYGEVKIGILEKPAYKSFIEGQAFEKYKKKDVASTLHPNEKTIFDDVKQKGYQSSYASHPDAQFTVVMKGDNTDLPKSDMPVGVSDVKWNINASDLISKEAFEAWQKSHPMPGMPIENILSQIKRQVEQKMKQRGPQSLPPPKFEAK